MGTFNWFKNLIEPIGEMLQRDPRFNNVRIFYDRSPEKIPPATTMPCINYFLDAPWEDASRGSGSTSIQARRSNARLGFGIWVCHQNDSELDRQLFDLSSDLMDFLYEHRWWDERNGIAIIGDLVWDVDYTGAENGTVGTQRIVVQFESITTP